MFVMEQAVLLPQVTQNLRRDPDVTKTCSIGFLGLMRIRARGAITNLKLAGRANSLSMSLWEHTLRIRPRYR